tara:strand:+ start:32 stop:781 length:750 start_codon:yes stop_codon:yes gene_type:complete
MKDKKFSFIGLIPARSGSKRVPNKNMRNIGDESLIKRAVKQSLNSNYLDSVYIITDSKEYENEALCSGANSLGLRPANISTEFSADREWLLWFLQKLRRDSSNKINFNKYVILRPTSPFRTGAVIDSAIRHYIKNAKDSYTCLRSVQKVKEHPGKMWKLQNDEYLNRLFPFENQNTPWSDCQYASLPDFYIQNAMIEIGTIESIISSSMPISGFSTLPFIEDSFATLDINNEIDINFANYLISQGIINE